MHPEYYVTGFTWASDAPPGTPTGERLAETIPWPLTERLARLAADLRVWLIPGTFYERGEDGTV